MKIHILFILILGWTVKSYSQPNPDPLQMPPPAAVQPQVAQPQVAQPQAPPPQAQDVSQIPPSTPSVPGQPVAVPDANAGAPVPPSEPVDPLLEGFFEDIGYNPGTDRRDPFLPYLSPALRMAQAPDVPLEPLQKFALAELKLIGIIWDVGKPKALIEDPTGRSHIIIENAKLGKEFGYVAAIREGEIIVVEQLISPEGKKSFQTKVLKLSAVKGVEQ